MEIKLFKNYCGLTTLVQECVKEALEDIETDVVYIKGIDNPKTGHIVDVFVDSCNFLGLEPIVNTAVPIQYITPDRICGISIWYYAETKSMILTIS